MTSLYGGEWEPVPQWKGFYCKCALEFLDQSLGEKEELEFYKKTAQVAGGGYQF